MIRISRTLFLAAAGCALALPLAAQRTPANLTPISAAVPPASDPRLTEIAASTQAARVEADIRRLAGFGTRHTLSDTTSQTRGIGAARRWLFAEFTRISQACGGCLEVRYVAEIVPGSTAPGSRIRRDVNVVDVVAIQRGKVDPNRFVIIQGHYDSRNSDANDSAGDAPGANDDASGVAVALESARVLSKYQFDGSIVYAALAGEEQGLNGGQILARYARANGWNIQGVQNNDIVGDSRMLNGTTDNTRARVFGAGIPVEATQGELRRYLYSGGELDTPSRELMRYMDHVASAYVPNLDVMMVYRLDRFGRGGDHTPFFQLGYPAVRVTAMYEDYTRQHQNIRVENGIRYGDVPDMVDFPYVARMAALNATSAASLSWAPPAPDSVSISGAVTPNTTLRWKAVSDPNLAGYRVYWREPESAQWQFSRWVGSGTEVTLPGIIIDNYFFGVVAVDKDGHESRAVFPAPGPAR